MNKNKLQRKNIKPIAQIAKREGSEKASKTEIFPNAHWGWHLKCEYISSMLADFLSVIQNIWLIYPGVSYYIETNLNTDR